MKLTEVKALLPLELQADKVLGVKKASNGLVVFTSTSSIHVRNSGPMLIKNR